ncbi:nuclear transport factor 2 family protein [Embleya sp. NPDC059237]|uniref:nuclear transport factor 2 family protein n=1 Tax=Embleya sp. NPDC059237 TaxID=3346784 RepID=UPI0036904639
MTVPKTPEDRIRAAHTETLRVWIDALHRDDVAAYVACYAPEADVADIPLQAGAQGLKSLYEAIDMWLRILHHERVELQTLLEGDGHTAAVLSVTFVMLDQIPSVPERIKIGSRGTVRTIMLFRFDENAKIVFERGYWDLGELLRQIRVDNQDA